jgi:hypothetical protein
MNVVSQDPDKKQRWASVIARMSNPSFPRKMLRIKGARHAHKTILAQGRKLCAEANEARRRNAAARREAKAKQAKLTELHGEAWRVGSADMSGI